MNLYTINGYYKVRKEGKYPWPCQAFPHRTIQLYEDDVLTYDDKKGTFSCHTGLGCFGILLEFTEVIKVDDEANLVVL